MYTSLRNGFILYIVARIARLQVIIVGLDTEVVYGFSAVEDTFQFIAPCHDRPYFRRHSKPIETGWRQLDPIAFHSYAEAFCMQTIDKLFVCLQCRFTTCEHDKSSLFPLTNSSNDIFDRHFAVCIEVGIAERALQVTTAETDKHCGPTGIPTLPLQ